MSDTVTRETLDKAIEMLNRRPKTKARIFLSEAAAAAYIAQFGELPDNIIVSKFIGKDAQPLVMLGDEGLEWKWPHREYSPPEKSYDHRLNLGDGRYIDVDATPKATKPSDGTP